MGYWQECWSSHLGSEMLDEGTETDGHQGGSYEAGVGLRDAQAVNQADIA